MALNKAKLEAKKKAAEEAEKKKAAEKEAAKKAVAEKKEAAKNNLPAKTGGAGLPALPSDLNIYDDKGAGQENMTAEDFSVPRFTILQQLSPQCDKTKPEHIEGAEPGMIINTVTGELFDGDEGIEIIAMHYIRNHLEWKPRAKGGGFVKNWGPSPKVLESCKIDENRNAITVDGNEIVATAEYFCFYLKEDGQFSPAVISMAKTQLKKARNWNTQINELKVPRPDGAGTFNPAMWYRTYRLTTQPESNDKGSWFGWVIEPGQNVLEMEDGAAKYMAAREFQQRIKAGEVKAADKGLRTDDGQGGGADQI